MQVNLDNDIHSYTVRAYQPGEISLTLPYSADKPAAQTATDRAPQPLEVETICGNFILSPKQLLRDWAPSTVEELMAEHLDAIVALQPELVLLGTGTRLIFPQPQILSALHQQRIGVEVMDTAAACRTYNILMTEGRFVVAGLMNPAQ